MAANVITGIRIVCALGMIFCPIFSRWFYALYIVGGVSDVLDGITARHFGKETKFGARFDTIADIIFMAIVSVKMIRTIPLPLWIFIWIVGIAAMKLVSVFIGVLKYKRFVSEHTVMNKICGVLLFALPFCADWLPRQLTFVLIILICGIATAAAVQEGLYIRGGKEIR